MKPPSKEIHSGQQKGVIGVFPCREAAGQALDQLVLSGFPLAQLFLVGENSTYGRRVPEIAQIRELLHQAPVDDITGTKDDFFQTIKGGIAGGVAGLLLSLGLAVLPGVGPMIFGFTIASVLLSSAAFSMVGGLLGALISLGAVRKKAKDYATQISRGNYLLIVIGTRADILRAEHILHKQGIRQ
jgi:hypothetical protein